MADWPWPTGWNSSNPRWNYSSEGRLQVANSWNFSIHDCLLCQVWYSNKSKFVWRYGNTRNRNTEFLFVCIVHYIMLLQWTVRYDPLYVSKRLNISSKFLHNFILVINRRWVVVAFRANDSSPVVRRRRLFAGRHLVITWHISDL